MVHIRVVTANCVILRGRIIIRLELCQQCTKSDGLAIARFATEASKNFKLVILNPSRVISLSLKA